MLRKVSLSFCKRATLSLRPFCGREFAGYASQQQEKDFIAEHDEIPPDPNLIETEDATDSDINHQIEHENMHNCNMESMESNEQVGPYSSDYTANHITNFGNFREISDIELPTNPNSNANKRIETRKRTKDERIKQQEVWTQIRTTINGIWDNLESIDYKNIGRTDKMYSKLNELTTLHVKNVQSSLHYLSLVNDDINTLNSRLDSVFDRLNDLEENSSMEWFEWRVPKYEIPFKEGTYLRSQGYEIGSMVWCIELRWEIDPSFTKMHNVNDITDMNQDESGPAGNPIMGMSEFESRSTTDDTNDDNEEKEESKSKAKEKAKPRAKEEDGGDNSLNTRLKKGYHRLGVYVSPRSVSNWEQLSSLKAKCEVRINDANNDNNNNEKSDRINGEKLHFNVSGDFLRGSRLVSWGRTLSKGDLYFGGSKNMMDDDNEIDIKLRISSQTMSYKTDILKDKNKNKNKNKNKKKDQKNTEHVVADIVNDMDNDNDIEDTDNNNNNMNIDSSSSILHVLNTNKEIDDLCSIPLQVFWTQFTQIIPQNSISDAALSKLCDIAVDDQFIEMISMFRKGPLLDDGEQDNGELDEQLLKSAATGKRKKTKKEKEKEKSKQKQYIQARNTAWQSVSEYDRHNSQFRSQLAKIYLFYKEKQNNDNDDHDDD